MREGYRDAGHKEGTLPVGQVVVPQLVLLNAWFKDIDRFGEPAAAHETAVLDLLQQGYSFDEIDGFCRQRDQVLDSWGGIDA